MRHLKSYTLPGEYVYILGGRQYTTLFCSFSLSPAIIGKPSQVAIDTQISDNAGVKNVTAYIKGPTPSNNIVGSSDLSLTAGRICDICVIQNGTWDGTLTFPSNDSDGNYTIEAIAFDNSGNFAKDSGNVLLDRTPPTITTSQQGQNFTLHQIVSPDFHCTDNISGIATFQCLGE